MGTVQLCNMATSTADCCLLTLVSQAGFFFLDSHWLGGMLRYGCIALLDSRKCWQDSNWEGGLYTGPAHRHQKFADPVNRDPAQLEEYLHGATVACYPLVCCRSLI